MGAVKMHGSWRKMSIWGQYILNNSVSADLKFQSFLSKLLHQKGHFRFHSPSLKTLFRSYKQRKGIKVTYRSIQASSVVIYHVIFLLAPRQNVLWCRSLACSTICHLQAAENAQDANVTAGKQSGEPEICWWCKVFSFLRNISSNSDILQKGQGSIEL